jgi:hypothetical protein
VLYKVNKHPLRDVNDNIDAVPHFRDCTDILLRYVFLMWDYNSPYRKIPVENRKKHVMMVMGIPEKEYGSFVSDNYEQIHVATKEFNRQQFDIEFEALVACRAQIASWNELLKKEEKSDKEEALAFKVFDKLPDYMKRLKTLEEIVGEREVMADDEQSEETTLEMVLNEKE